MTLLRRFVTVSSVLALTIAPAAALAYPDVSSKHESVRAIEYMRLQNIMTGNPDGTFRPDAPVNRAELMKILVQAESMDAERFITPDACFPDVSKEDWFSPYVCAAAARGWVKGYPDGLFRPEQQVNFVEALKMIEESRFAFQRVSRYVDRTVFFSQKEYQKNWYDPYLGEAINGWLISQQTFDRDGQAIDGPTPRKRIAEMLYRSFLAEGKVRWPVDFARCRTTGEAYGGLYGILEPFTTYELPGGLTSEGQELVIKNNGTGEECTLEEDINPYDRITKDFGNRKLTFLTWSQNTEEGGRTFRNGPLRNGEAYFLDYVHDDGLQLHVWKLDRADGSLRQVAQLQSNEPFLLTPDDILFSVTFSRIYAQDLKTGRKAVVEEVEMPFIFEANSGPVPALKGYLRFEDGSIHYKVYEAENPFDGPFTFVEERSKKIDELEFTYD